MIITYYDSNYDNCISVVACKLVKTYYKEEPLLDIISNDDKHICISPDDLYKVEN